jgi:disulfide bond formation protein DsbB
MSVSGTTDPLTAPTSPSTGPAASPWLWAAFLGAVAGLAGSLFLSLGMGLKACPLCFYQRAFMMSLVAVLGVGMLAGAARPGRLGLLAMPLAVAGLGVALFHVSLELRGKLECPGGLLGLGTAPQQSLIVFLALTALLAVDAVRGLRAWGLWAALPGTVVLGALLAVGSTVANPPPPGCTPAALREAPGRVPAAIRPRVAGGGEVRANERSSRCGIRHNLWSHLPSPDLSLRPRWRSPFPWPGGRLGRSRNRRPTLGVSRATGGSAGRPSTARTAPAATDRT